MVKNKFPYLDHTVQDQEEHDVNVEKCLAVAEIKLTFNKNKIHIF